MKKSNIKINLLILIVSFCVGLFAVEFTVRMVVPVRNVGPAFSVYHPIFGKSLKSDFSAIRKTPEFTMKLSTNSFGFRGPKSKTLPKHSILFLGDSFTMGYGVNDRQEYPAIIAARLSENEETSSIKVINAGIGDSGNGRWIKLLQHIGYKIQPHLVVMQILDNDFGDNLRERMFEIDPTGNLIELPVPKPSFGRNLQSVIELIPGLDSTNIIGLLRQLSQKLPRNNTEQMHIKRISSELLPDDQLTIKIIDAAISICKKNGWPILALAVGLKGSRKSAIRDLFNKYEINILEVPGKNSRPDLYYKVDGHWNVNGHIEAAERVFNELLHRKLVP